ncbi:hypothetical protein TU77_00570 [Pseudomonas synxantha]|nr:hypothetical protein TU77_00570 [Pseudomonas synxantha]
MLFISKSIIIDILDEISDQQPIGFLRMNYYSRIKIHITHLVVSRILNSAHLDSRHKYSRYDS